MYNVFIGMDLGAKAGISVIEGDIMLSHEAKFGGKEEPLKYKKFWDHICKIFDTYETCKPIVFYEYVARHLGTKAAHAYGAYRMILLMACHDRDIPCKELSVQAIKKTATGKGAAKKDVMIESATNRFKPDWKLTDNEADSMWIAYLGREMTLESFEADESSGPLRAFKRNGSVFDDSHRKRVPKKD